LNILGKIFDNRGFPNSERHVVYETRLPQEVYKVRISEKNKRAATRDLREQIKASKVNKNMFTAKQLNQIMKGEPRIDKLILHHHQETGRMQLIPHDIHKQTGHTGGMELWYK